VTTVEEPSTATLAAADAAAYRALAGRRISAADRRVIAARTVTVLAAVDPQDLPYVVRAGQSAGVVYEIHKAVPYTVPLSKRSPAVGAAVVAAAQALLASLKEG
jgi:hypothetical protein